jgi:hypothetical protein
MLFKGANSHSCRQVRNEDYLNMTSNEARESDKEHYNNECKSGICTIKHTSRVLLSRWLNSLGLDDFQQGKIFVLLATASTPALGPAKPPI